VAVAPASGLISAAEVRYLAAAILEPDPDQDLAVLAGPVDSLTPPVLMMLEGDPWVTPGARGVPTMGPCIYEARLVVWAIAHRFEPGTGIDKTDELNAYVTGRMAADAYTWRLEGISGPRVLDWGDNKRGKIEYLFSSLTYLVPVTV
jgi:hypothetical protein